MAKESPITLKEAWPHDIPLGWYILAVLAAASAIRLFLSSFKVLETRYNYPFASRPFHREITKVAGGFSTDPTHRDYLLPFGLGVLELFTFPLLINAQVWSFIGAWLGFKVVAQWGHWGENRPAFNRFLIGTALILIFSVGLAVHYFHYGLIK